MKIILSSTEASNIITELVERQVKTEVDSIEVVVEGNSPPAVKSEPPSLRSLFISPHILNSESNLRENTFKLMRINSQSEKILWIRLLKQATGRGLIECKEFVEKYGVFHGSVQSQ